VIQLTKNNTFTSAGTNIEEVKQLNASSGLSYNEVKALLAKTGGTGTKKYSNTNIDQIRNELTQDDTH
jgi:hypothetical protein